MPGPPRLPSQGFVRLNRREVLRLMFAGAAATVVPLRYVFRKATAAPLPSGYLTSAELRILDAATARIIPTDSQPGARECGVVNYIQSMLSFMPGSDANCDRDVNAADVTATILRLNAPSQASCPDGGDVDGDGVVSTADVIDAESAVFDARPAFAGGPFSGRQPQPHFAIEGTACQVCHVAPDQREAAAPPRAPATSNVYPPDFFAQFSRLPRLQRLSWRIRIVGAATVPEVVDNPLTTTLLETDLRRKYREGLAALDTLAQEQFGQPFVALTAAQQSLVLGKADPDFVTLLTYHTVEGLLCPPEYGGNRDLLGWQLVGFDGDSQPLGYEIYDESVPGNYRERPDKPNSGPNPDEDCRGFNAGINNFLNIISNAPQVQPGQRFSNPYCFDVPA